MPQQTIPDGINPDRDTKEKADELDPKWFIGKFRPFPTSFCSGSPQPSASDIKAILDGITSPDGLKAENIIFIDLREEAHFLEAGQPVQHESKKYNDEESYAINHNKNVETHDFLKPKYDRKKKLITERELVEATGARYVRLPVSNHGTPSPEIVDHFIKLALEAIKNGEWLHIHCHGGKGRTTTFIEMYKQIRLTVNPDEKQTEDEMAEKKLKLKEPSQSDKAKEDSAEKIARVKFIQDFREYIEDIRKSGRFQGEYTPWSEWRGQHNAPRASMS